MSVPFAGPSYLHYPLNRIALTSLVPNNGVAAGNVLVVANGENFNGACVIYFNGVAQATTFLSEKSVRATIALGAAGVRSVYVFDPSTGRKTKPLNFTVT
jgi:hypothetical protein